MKAGAALRIMAVALICVLGLVAVVVSEGAARAAGREVMMEMQPVDPRSLLSGHYVMLNLEARVGGADVCSAFSTDENAFWLALAPAPAGLPNNYAPRGKFASREEAARNGAFAVRGDATCTQLPDDKGAPQNVAIVRTELDGVSRFYIEQAEAERIDALMRQQTTDAPAPVMAILSLGNDGRARLKGLLVNGRRLELNWL
jgi:hypothetical protein